MTADWPEDCPPEDERDVMLKRLCSKVRSVLRLIPSLSEEIDDQIGELELLADDIEGWYEDDDPRSMGWVGDDGLP